MKQAARFGLFLVCVLSPLALSPSPTQAQGGPPRGATRSGSDSAAADRSASDNLTSQDRDYLNTTNEMAREVTQLLERWIASGAVSEDKLFSRLYYVVPKTDPAKFTTDYDALADRELSPIQERVLSKSSNTAYAVLSDVNGYVPTHNQRYAQPLTGNLAVDLVNNRTKRIFGDKTGFAAARNVAPYLLQRYQRDTGEAMADLSVPILIRGRHWGCVRVGYRVLEKL